MYGLASSTVLSLGCKLHNNLAKGGNGGAGFFDARSKQNLALQLVQSCIENNATRMGGRHRPFVSTPVNDTYS